LPNAHIDDYEQYARHCLESLPEVVSNFKHGIEALQVAAKETTIAFERIAEPMQKSTQLENKKRKGYERPYKFHR